MATIGTRNTLRIVRAAPPGLYLDGEALGEILLPGRYVPPGSLPEGKVEVFVYRDSEDRLVATTETPHAMVGDFAFLKVVSVNRQIGAFLDWGLVKDLLLPFREQEGPVNVGQRVVVAIYLDPVTQRIAATMRWNRHLSHERPPYETGQAVELLVTGKTPLGYTAIVENAFSGLLYHDNLATGLEIGRRLTGFVHAVREDGKIDLRLDASGYQRVASLTGLIIQALERSGGRLEFDDSSSPEMIRAEFGVSKKAFKQALGRLYRSRRIRFERAGIELLDNSTFEPGE